MNEVDLEGLFIVSLNIEIIVRRKENVVKRRRCVCNVLACHCENETDVLLVYLKEMSL